MTAYSRGLDTRDYALLRSVWADDPDISYDLSNVGVERELLTYHSAEEMARDAEAIHAPLLAGHDPANGPVTGTTVAIGRLAKTGVNFGAIVRALQGDSRTNIISKPTITMREVFRSSMRPS